MNTNEKSAAQELTPEVKSVWQVPTVEAILVSSETNFNTGTPNDGNNSGSDLVS